MNLIIDGNYILYRNVFSLTREKLLYGYLYDSLVKSIDSYSKWFPFNNVYFISDSKTNWRKHIYPEYKANRKKSDDIDWEFVHTIYEEFKAELPKRYKLLEMPLVEGDDWFHYLTKFHNRRDESCLMVSNDGDLKQLLKTGPSFINIMVNENNLHNNIFLPVEYKTWLSIFSENIKIPDLFDDEPSENLEIYEFFKKLISDRNIKDIKRDEILFEKIVAGDRGDNIKSVWGKKDKNGTIRGIGEKTAKKIYDKYIEYFGIPNFDEECFDRISDLIIEQKKLNSSEFDGIIDNINFNNKLVNFKLIPNNIMKIIKDKHREYDIN